MCCHGYMGINVAWETFLSPSLFCISYCSSACFSSLSSYFWHDSSIFHITHEKRPTQVPLQTIPFYSPRYVTAGYDGGVGGKNCFGAAFAYNSPWCEARPLCPGEEGRILQQWRRNHAKSIFKPIEVRSTISVLQSSAEPTTQNKQQPEDKPGERECTDNNTLNSMLCSYWATMKYGSGLHISKMCCF